MSVAQRNAILLIALATFLVVGCSADERIAEVSREAADRQANQNELIAQQSREVSGATKAIVEADAHARKEFVAIHKDVQAQQGEIGRQRDQLEKERTEIAEDRRWDSLLSSSITTVGLILACFLPVLYSIYLLRATRDEQASDRELAELLTQELVAEQPVLLPPIRQTQPDALEYSGATGDEEEETDAEEGEAQ